MVYPIIYCVKPYLNIFSVVR